MVTLLFTGNRKLPKQHQRKEGEEGEITEVSFSGQCRRRYAYRVAYHSFSA